MYALNLSDDNRILSACVPLPNAEDENGEAIVELADGKYNGMVVVDLLPDDDVTNYLYVNGEYVYDPFPKPEEPEEQPSQLDVLEAQVTYTAMMTDTLLEV